MTTVIVRALRDDYADTTIPDPETRDVGPWDGEATVADLAPPAHAGLAIALRPCLGQGRADSVVGAPVTEIVLAPSELPPSERAWDAATVVARPVPSASLERDMVAPVVPAREAVQPHADPRGKPTPVRTWSLLVVTVLAAVLVLTMGSGGEDEVAGEAPGVHTDTRGRQEPPAAGGGHARGEVSRRGSEPGAGPTVRVPDTRTLPAAGEGDGRSALASRAADLLIARLYREALPCYEQLARDHPDVAEYGLVVRILRARLSEDP